MPIMEDSGIDSEDKQSNIFEEPAAVELTSITTPTNTMNDEAFDASAVSHMADLEVVFRGSSGPIIGGAHVNTAATENAAKLIDGKLRRAASLEAGESDDDESRAVSQQPAPNTCRILQRKLELKVERAKRNFSQYQQQEQVRKSQSANLIPISRLPIPGDSEQKPLVDYKSDSSDGPEEITFFPAKVKNAQRKAELSDTFSIQEMTIDSDLDSDDSGSQNLELLPPLRKANFLESLKICFGCGSRRS